MPCIAVGRRDHPTATTTAQDQAIPDRLLRTRPLRTQIARTRFYGIDDLRVTTRLGKLSCGHAVGVLRRYLGPTAHQLDYELEMPSVRCAVQRGPLLGIPHSDQESPIHELSAARQVAGGRTVVQSGLSAGPRRLPEQRGALVEQLLQTTGVAHFRSLEPLHIRRGVGVDSSVLGTVIHGSDVLLREQIGHRARIHLPNANIGERY
jgi:hypothetical protein